MSQTKENTTEMHYTTGELAKLCGVTVRTVQYYDNRGILIPSALTEGGRRLYSEQDRRKLQIICFLRELDIPISGIAKLFDEEEPAPVIALLLSEQETQLRSEITERQERLAKLEVLARELKSVECISVESIGDVAYHMENKKQLKRTRAVMLTVGLIMDAIEIGTLVLWITKGIWLPFAIGMVFVVLMGIWISIYYFKRVAYICPRCHAVFRPTFRAAFFAPHTPRTRKLTCACGYRGYCVETYAEGAERRDRA